MRRQQLQIQRLPNCCSLVYACNTDSIICQYPDINTFIVDVLNAIREFNQAELEDNHPNRVFRIGGLKGVMIVTNLGFWARLQLRLKLGASRSTRYAKGVRVMIIPIKKNQLLANV